MEQQNEELKELKDKIAKIEYVEIKEIKDEVNQIKLELNTDHILTKQAIDSNEKLSTTMDTIKTAMVELGQTVKDSNKVTSELATTVTKLNDKIDSVEVKMDKQFGEVNNKVKEIDDKAKIDWQLFIKNNWLGAVMGIGAIVYAISQFLK